MREKENEASMKIKYEDHFYYDETSPTCLRWSHDVYVGRRGLTLKLKSGDAAGSLSSYRDGTPAGSCVSVNKQKFRVHRVIWEMFNGPIPKGMIIDHLDGNPHNNIINNLACKTQRQNTQNSSRNKNNTSGITGVSRRKFNTNPVWYWQARVRINDKVVAKSFSTAKHGEEGARLLAKSWREEQLKLLNEQGEAYTERHGT